MVRYFEQGIGYDTPQDEVSTQTAIDRALIHTWTAMPAIIQKFYPEDQVADVKVTILQEYITPAQDKKYREHPLLSRVPVFFLGNSGFSITHDLAAGDHGIVIFASRCIDDWFATGELTQPATRRKHSFSDGMFIPGLRAKTKKIENFGQEGIQIRNSSASVKIILSDSGIDLIGDVNITGTLKVNNVDVGDTHVHSGVEAGSDFSGPPKP